MSADEMFEKLGYLVEEDNDKCRIYKIACFGNILMVIFNKDCSDEKYRLKIYENYISMELLQAINQKVKELGWLDE